MNALLCGFVTDRKGTPLRSDGYFVLEMVFATLSEKNRIVVISN